MDKKQVVIVSLLSLAIILSAASVLMNVAVINGVTIEEAPNAPQKADVSIEILPTQENTGENVNGLG